MENFSGSVVESKTQSHTVNQNHTPIITKPMVVLFVVEIIIVVVSIVALIAVVLNNPNDEVAIPENALSFISPHCVGEKIYV